MKSSPINLGVNIDHVATLRQARGTLYPDPTEAAHACEQAGAHGITVHLREDRRHIQDRDVEALRKSIRTRLNLELANAEEIVKIAVRVAPHEACLVPERREELTTEGGLDVAGQLDSIRKSAKKLAAAGVDVSLFIDPDPNQVAAAAECGVPYIELHTGTFCDAPDADAETELRRLIEAAQQAKSLGLNVNAGHGINMGTIDQILRIPHLDTLNIGHSIVSRAVFLGLDEAVREMLTAMSRYAGGEET